MGTGVSPPPLPPGNLDAGGRKLEAGLLSTLPGLQTSFFHVYEPSIVKVLACVRHSSRLTPHTSHHISGSLKTTQARSKACARSSPRPISTGRLNTLLHLHLRPINQLILLGSYLVNPVGNLILRSASRLDAFSAYPFQTWLPSCASGETTGTPAVCPSRSSRTRDSSSQVSCACDG